MKALLIVAAIIAAADDPDPDTEDDAEHPSRAPTTAVRYSPVEVLRSKDFSQYTATDYADAQRLMARLRATAAMRRSRRRRPAKWRRHSRPDIRATVRRALRIGGEPIRRAWFAPTLQPRRLFCYVTSAARWTPSPGRYCGSCTQRWLAAAAWKPSPWERA
ncbi:hypothetical protein [Mycobacterium szulgai]|nr:hypothetical protein [Mycobacterium szulgai]